MGIGIFQIILLLGMIVIYFVPVVLILRKAGYSGWWSIMGLVPYLNVVALFVFAIRKWPIEAELEAVGTEID